MGTIKTFYNLKDKVYLEDEDEQVIYTIVGIVVRGSGEILYEISHCGEVHEVHECELSKIKRVV